MPISTLPEWQQLAIYALGAAVLLVVLFSIPGIGRLLRGLFSIGLLALVLFTLFQQAPYHPGLSRLAARVGLNDQQVVGDEVRIRMSPDGHFWAQVEVNGVPRRMLIDSGATVTALSEQTAALARVSRDQTLLPVLIRTANGVVRAETGAVDTLSFGGIEARRLKVLISPSLGSVDVLGMNFLSQLASWRVEGQTLVLTPPDAAG